MSDRPSTRGEALELALDWAEGRRSWLNLMMEVEPSPDARQQTLVATGQADAAEVVKWTALAAVLPEAPDGRRSPPCSRRPPMPDESRPDNLSAADVKPKRPLDPYEAGYLDGLVAYSWMRDGVKYVGTTGLTLRQATRAYLDEVGA